MLNVNPNQERLTWDEIIEKYPNQVVGLTEVKWETDDPDDPNVESAIVKYINSDKSELLKMQILEHTVYTTHTGQGVGFQVGVLMHE